MLVTHDGRHASPLYQGICSLRGHCRVHEIKRDRKRIVLSRIPLERTYMVPFDIIELVAIREIAWYSGMECFGNMSVSTGSLSKVNLG